MRRTNGASSRLWTNPRWGRSASDGLLSDRVGPLAGTVALLVALLAAPVAMSAPADDEVFVVIRAGNVIPIEGEEIRNGTVIIVDGKIRSVGRNIDYPKNATVIDARSETVMPGWIHPHSRWGLPGYTRSGVHGDLSVSTEYYPTADQFEDLLEQGFVAVALYPDGSGIPGRAMVLKTGGPVERRGLESPSYLRVTMRSLPGDKTTLRGAFEKAKAEIEKVEKARKEHEEKQKQAESQPAQEEKKPKESETAGKKADEEKDDKPETQPAATQPAEAKFEPPKIDPAVQIFVDMIQEKEGVFALVELDESSELLHLRDAVEDFNFPHALLLSNAGYYSDLGRMAEELGEEERQVVLYPQINRLPYTVTRTNIPRLLAAAGCEITLQPMGDYKSALEDFRGNLAQLVRAGLDRSDALASVTRAPARLLRIEESHGTLEKDKVGDIVFFSGDPFDPLAEVTRVMIGGELVYEAKEDGR